MVILRYRGVVEVVLFGMKTRFVGGYFGEVLGGHVISLPVVGFGVGIGWFFTYLFIYFVPI